MTTPTGRRPCGVCGNWAHICLCPLVNFTPEVSDGPVRILVAAIRLDGVVYALPRPARHHNVLRLMNSLGVPPPHGKEEQGFVASDGRFVGRKEGKLIAAAQEQLLPDAYRGDILFSECVW